MKPVKTEYSNITFVAEGCGDLPATLFLHPEGHEEVETCWELSDADIERILRDRRIYLYTVGRSVPPMAITAQSILVIEENKDVTL